MAIPRPSDELDARRAHSRLQLGIGARFDTIHGRQDVRLIDLSQAGAHLILSQPGPVDRGVLQWLRFDNFGVVVWQHEDHVGLEFDRLVPLPAIVETRMRAPSIVREEAMGDKLAARDWVAGQLDSSID